MPCNTNLWLREKFFSESMRSKEKIENNCIRLKILENRGKTTTRSLPQYHASLNSGSPVCTQMLEFLPGNDFDRLSLTLYSRFWVFEVMPVAEQPLLKAFSIIFHFDLSNFFGFPLIASVNISPYGRITMQRESDVSIAIFHHACTHTFMYLCFQFRLLLIAVKSTIEK